MRRSLLGTFFRPERPTLTSRSLQSITRPFQKRFREVFGNARILIFYLFIKAWEEKSLPKSHLGWFFLVFGESKATKENMSVFWFIWPLTPHFRAKFGYNSTSKFFVFCCHSDIDFTKNRILTNFYSKSITGEDFVAIWQGQNLLLKRLKNIGMVPENLYRNIFNECYQIV